MIMLGLAILLQANIGMAGRQSRADDCMPISGMHALSDRVASGRAKFIVFGERHGTNEAPALFSEIVCQISKLRKTNVFIEFRKSSSRSVQNYLSSDGSDAARAALMRESIWDPHFADGRNSVAIFNLIERIRLLKRGGRNIDVFCTQPDDTSSDDQYYDELNRANAWATIGLKRPATINLIIVGTAHAMLKDDGSLGFRPAASYLKSSDVIAIGPRGEGGSAWELDISPTGQPLMGPIKLPGKPSHKMGIRPVSSRTGWNAVYATGRPATPSLPAAGSAQK